MAQKGAFPAGKYGRQQPAMAQDPRVPDRIHRAVNAMQSAGRETVIDRATPEAERQELAPRRHAVLPRGELRDRFVRWRSWTLYFMVRLGHLGIGRIVAPETARVTASG
jgi:hypothetical protein